MILIATNKRDVTTDFVVRELRRRDLAFARLNTEDGAAWTATMRDGEPGALTLSSRDWHVDVAAVTAGYYRRPGHPDGGDAGEAVSSYVAAEWSAVLRSLWNALDGRWLNSPFAILRAEDKPRQLAVARAAGLSVPDTLVTNDFDAARAFTAAGATVGKTLRHALIEDGDAGKVIFTSRIGPLADADAAAVRRAPMILQREVAKRFDVRVIVVDGRTFATRIGSQAFMETRVDWRRGTRTDLDHEAFDLPPQVAAACVAVTRALSLRFAAIDLVEDLDGAFWFLEANPNGQWAWIEQRTGMRIAAAIVDGLVG